jgi:hypothetical protein
MKINDSTRIGPAKPVSPKPVERPKVNPPRPQSKPVDAFEAAGGRALQARQDQARADLKRWAAETLLDNEALGENKTDAEYAPMLKSALDRIGKFVDRLKDPGSPEAREALEEYLKGIRSELKMPYAEWKTRTDAERVCAERLMDNEANLEGLTDDQAIPILDAALEKLHQVAMSLPNPGTREYQQALDMATRELSRQMRAVPRP